MPAHRRIVAQVLASPCERSQKLARIHAIFERLPSIDKDDGDLIVIFLAQFRIAIDIHLAPLKIGFRLDPVERLFDYVAEMASLAGINYYVVHMQIVNTVAGQPQIGSGLVPIGSSQ